jgi:hypothetical protein
LAKLPGTLTPLLAARQAITSKNPGLTLAFYVEGLQASPQLQQSQPCEQADLVTDAQAQAVASAAGVSAGAILSMAAGYYGPAGAFQLVGAANSFTGVIAGGVGYPLPLLPTPQQTCSLTVQFQLM